MTHLAKSDYIWVKGANIDDAHPFGDMDRLKTSFNPDDPIRGIIMPMRTGSADPSRGIRGKNVLSGEDICYLAESVAEREMISAHGVSWLYDEIPFSRRIAAGNAAEGVNATPWFVANAIHNRTGFVKSISSERFNVSDAECFTDVSADEITSSPDDFSAGGILRSENVLKLFNDMKTLHTARQSLSSFHDEDSPYIGKVSYSEEYPYFETQSMQDSIEWFGGQHASGNIPAHAYGGIGHSTHPWRFSATVPGLRDDMDLAEPEVFVNWHLTYVSNDDGGRPVTITETSFELEGTATRSGEIVYLDMSPLAMLNKLIYIAQSQHGWRYGVPLPDEFGSKSLYITSATPWLVWPVKHTKYW